MAHNRPVRLERHATRGPSLLSGLMRAKHERQQVRDYEDKQLD